MERRKDNKGRVLKEGESQRKDGRYQYRYTDPFGNRKIIYSKDLRSLRELEDKIKADINNGAYVFPSNQTLCDLVEKYISIHKSSLKKKTKERIQCYFNVIKRYPIGNMPISHIKQSDAKMFLKSMYEEGRTYGTIKNYKSLIKPAFDMACEDGVLTKNPFDFKLSNVIQTTKYEKIAITDEQYNNLLAFLENSSHYNRYYYMIVVLYETGLRIGELCGLTVSDIDLENRKISVTHQLQQTINGTRYIETPKTKKGKRVVPISKNAHTALSIIVQHAINRKINPIIDGYTGFLFLNKDGNVLSPTKISTNFKRMVNAYNRQSDEDKQLPLITLHSFRHTFCTRLVLSGMDVKSVQYIMGHNSLSTTLSIYTHVRELDALKEFDKKINKMHNIVDTNAG